MTPLQRSRLEKAASDCGFELTPELHGAELLLRSAQFPESIAVEPLTDSTFILRADGAAILPGPTGAAERSQVDGYDALYIALGVT